MLGSDGLGHLVSSSSLASLVSFSALASSGDVVRRSFISVRENKEESLGFSEVLWAR